MIIDVKKSWNINLYNGAVTRGVVPGGAGGAGRSVNPTFPFI